MKQSIFSLLLAAFVFAASPVQAALNLQIDPLDERSLLNLSMVFCGEGVDGAKHISLKTVDNEPLEVCVRLTNIGRLETTVQLDWVDGTVTNDASQNKACRMEGINKMFGQYVKGFDHHITLDPKSTVELTGYVEFPDAYAGKALGCATYSVYEGGPKSGVINVVTRKAHFIDVLVDGTPISDFYLDTVMGENSNTMGENLSNNNYLGVYRINEGFELLYTYVNTGNIPQDVVFEVQMNGPFGLNISETGTRKVLPGESLLQKNAIKNIPWYVWNVDIALKGTATAVIPEGMSVGDDFEIVPIDFEESTSLRIITGIHIIFLVGLIIIILLILRLIAKKRKKKKEAMNDMSGIDTMEGENMEKKMDSEEMTDQDMQKE